MSVRADNSSGFFTIFTPIPASNIDRVDILNNQIHITGTIFTRNTIG